MSIDDLIGAPRTAHAAGRHRGHPQSLRWAMFRLVALWVPMAAVLAFALWNLLFFTLAPWDHHDGGNPPGLDALPSQLLFAVLLVLAGRFEMTRRRGSQASSSSVRVYWALTALLIGLGVAALSFMAMHQPVLQ